MYRARRASAPAGRSGQALPPAGEENYLFSRRDVLIRLKAHSPGQYAGLFNVMKGVTLAAVGIVVVKLVGGEIPLARALLLAIALMGILVSYNGEAIGQEIIHLPPTTLDVALPMALTVAELLVVGLSAVDDSLGQMPTSWFVAFAVWNFLAAILVRSVATRLNCELYERDFWPALEAYRNRMLFDSKCAFAVGLFTLSFTIGRHIAQAEAQMPDYAFIALVAVALLGALRHHEATRKELQEALISIAGRR